jgi:hypothetical protein
MKSGWDSHSFKFTDKFNNEYEVFANAIEGENPAITICDNGVNYPVMVDMEYNPMLIKKVGRLQKQLEQLIVKRYFERYT